MPARKDPPPHANAPAKISASRRLPSGEAPPVRRRPAAAKPAAATLTAAKPAAAKPAAVKPAAAKPAAAKPPAPKPAAAKPPAAKPAAAKPPAAAQLGPPLPAPTTPALPHAPLTANAAGRGHEAQADAASPSSPHRRPAAGAPTSRGIAAHVITRVLHAEAFAAAVLSAELDKYPELDPRERALATELVYGALRAAGYLDEQLEAAASRGISRLDDAVRAELWVAAYQVLLLERIPDFAAVSEAVNRLRALRGQRVAAFGNAVLRKLCAGKENQANRPRTTAEAAARAAAPWLRQALGRALGAEGARDFLGAETPPPIGLRLGHGRDRAEWLSHWSRESTGRFEVGRISPLCVLARNIGDPTRLAGYADGVFAVQEEGAQVVALAVGAQAGDRVLDACAGRGNKTTLLADIAGVTVDSADLHPSKLERLGRELERLSLRGGERYPVDWTVGPGHVPAGYDKVLVDAPCSGTGTLRRRPELALRRRDVDLTELSDLQFRITSQAASRLRVGGVLTYAVCSVLCAEGEDVVARLTAGEILAGPERLRLEPCVLAPIASISLGTDVPTTCSSSLRLLPHVHGTDGYFLAGMRRVQ